jgi:hypothetical protein
MENKIPTAEEFAWDKIDFQTTLAEMKYQEVYYLMIEFTKLHVESALKEASNKALLKDEGRYVLGDEDWHEDLVVDKKSILNAYPLTNVK